MRLIDAEALKERLVQAEEDEYRTTAYILHLTDALPIIDKAETIDAIPVEWMREKLIDHPELPYSLTDGINAVIAAWEDWQKEQEGNNGEVR